MADSKQTAVSADAYWPSMPVTDLLPRAVAQIDAYHEYTWQSGRVDLWQRTLDTYARALVRSRLERVGRKGQFLKLAPNDFASLVRRAHTLITAEPPGMKCEPLNGDYTARAAVSLGEGCLEFYLRLRNVAETLERGCWRGFLAGEGINFTWWDPNRGEIEDVDPETGRPVFGGDIDVVPLHPIDLIRDVTCRSYRECEWFIVRTRVNRWNLLALYAPGAEAEGADEKLRKLREQILAASKEDAKGWGQRTIGLVDASARDRETDQVEVFHLIHERTPAVPRGRWVTFLNAETALVDQTLDDMAGEPFEGEDGELVDPPSFALTDFIQRTAAEECESIPFGFSSAWEQLEVQDAVNIGESTIITNLATHGVQTIAAPVGTVVKPSMIAEGMRLLEGESPRAEGEIKAVSLLNISDAMLTVPDRLVRRMGTNFGVNDTARGNPPQGIKAGNALALLTTQTVESLQGPEKAKDRLWEMTGSAIIKHFQRNVKAERLAAIVGTGSEQHVKALKGSDLRAIQRVKVESVPYTSRTGAQKRDTAEFFAGIPNSGLTIEDYKDVLATGSLGPRFDKARDKFLMIQKENEMLLAGKVPRAMISDHPIEHLQEHLTLLDRPEAREDELFKTNVLAHVQEHINLWTVMPPAIAMLLGVPQVPPPNMMGMGGPGAGGPQSSPQAGAIDDVQALAGQATRAPEPAGDPRIQLPVANPATGEQASVAIAQPPEMVQ